LTAGFVAVSTAFAAHAAEPANSTQAAIKAENARWAEAYQRGDYQAIGHLYTAEGILLPPGGQRIRGQAAITAYFAQSYEGKAPDSVTFSNFEFYGDDDVVTEISDADIHGPDGQLKSRGKQTLVFLRREGVWKLHRDLWNDSGALPPGER